MRFFAIEKKLFVIRLLKQENGGEFQSVFDFCPTVLRYSSLFLDINKKINILKHFFFHFGPEFSKQTIISLENPKYVRDNFDLTKSLSNFALNQSHFEQLQNYSKYSERFQKY